MSGSVKQMPTLRLMASSGFNSCSTTKARARPARSERAGPTAKVKSQPIKGIEPIMPTRKEMMMALRVRMKVGKDQG